MKQGWHEEFDLTVVGGGISGLFFAWRYLKYFKETHNIQKKILILEAGTELGGRISKITTKDGDLIDLGPIRLRSNHRHMLKIISDLGLKTLPMECDQTSFFYIKGLLLSNEELRQKSSELYELEDSEKNQTSNELLTKKLSEFVTNSKAIKNIDYRDFLKKILSPGALRYVTDCDGYDSNFDRSNALDGIRYHLESNQRPIKTYGLNGGIFKLIEHLSKEIKKLGGEIQTSQKVSEFNEYTHNGINYLNLETRSRKLSSKNVVFAIPKKQIREISCKNILRTENSRRILNSIETQSAAKSIHLFEHCWWAKKYPKNFTITLDKSPRIIRFRSMEGGLHVVEFFSDYSHDKQISKSLEEFKIKGFNALSEIFSTQIPRPVSSFSTLWDAKNSTGSYHIWNPGIDSISQAEKVLRLSHNSKVFICGEAYSNRQSWMEGAVLTAETILQKYFGITPFVYHIEEKELLDGILETFASKQRKVA